MADLHKRKWLNKQGKPQWAWCYKWKENGKDHSVQSKIKQVVEKAKQEHQERKYNHLTNDKVDLVSSYNQYVNSLNNQLINKDIGIGHVKDCKSIYTHQILNKLNNVNLKDIDYIWIENYIAKLRNDGLTDAYIKRVFHIFKAIYDVNVPKLIRTNPFVAKDFFKKSRKSTTRDMINFDIWSFSKIQELISFVPNKPTQLMFKLMVDTACRPSEARAASRTHLKVLSNTPHFEVNFSIDRDNKLKPPKTDEGHRTVTISANLKDELVSYINTLPKNQEYLFLNGKGNFIDLKSMTKDLNIAIQAISKKYKIDYFSNRKTYSFRHWAASKWAYDGIYENAIDLCRDMGDKSVDFVYKNYIKRYGKKPDPKISAYKDTSNAWGTAV